MISTTVAELLDPRGNRPTEILQGVHKAARLFHSESTSMMPLGKGRMAVGLLYEQHSAGRQPRNPTRL
jgi:hypothetical protein